MMRRDFIKFADTLRDLLVERFGRASETWIDEESKA